MKCETITLINACMTSPPARGAWVEIIEWDAEKLEKKSPPARGAWVEIFNWNVQTQLV